MVSPPDFIPHPDEAPPNPADALDAIRALGRELKRDPIELGKSLLDTYSDRVDLQGQCSLEPDTWNQGDSITVTATLQYLPHLNAEWTTWATVDCLGYVQIVYVEPLDLYVVRPHGLQVSCTRFVRYSSPSVWQTPHRGLFDMTIDSVFVPSGTCDTCHQEQYWTGTGADG